MFRPRAKSESAPRRRPLTSSLNRYRLSKFQDYLPKRFALEVVENYLLDVAGTVALAEPGGDSVGASGVTVTITRLRSENAAQLSADRLGLHSDTAHLDRQEAKRLASWRELFGADDTIWSELLDD